MFESDFSNAGARWQLLRIRAHCEVDVTILSSRFFSLATHFVRVTVPCSGDDCALCEVLPRRGLFYLAALCRGVRSIVELSAFGANDLEQHAKLLHGGLRPGLRFRIARKGAKGPLHSEVLEYIPSVREVEPLVFAQRVLAIYKYPCCNPGDTIEEYERRVQQLAVRRNELLAKQLLNSKSVDA